VLTVIGLLGVGAGQAEAYRSAALNAHIGPEATLRAKGTYIVLRIIYRCPSEVEFAGVDISVSEDLGGDRTATAFTFASTAAHQIVCDGERHVLRLAVAPDEYAFRRGTAQVEASFGAFTESTSEFFTISKSIDIVKT
jgi:hypothetical protein